MLTKQQRSDLRQLVAHLNRHQEGGRWSLEADPLGGFYLRPYRAVRIFAGGTVWAASPVSIDASMADADGKCAAIRLAKAMATGWLSTTAAIGNSFAVFAGGRLVGRCNA
jgi:hypothetical protein